MVRAEIDMGRYVRTYSYRPERKKKLLDRFLRSIEIKRCETAGRNHLYKKETHFFSDYLDLYNLIFIPGKNFMYLASSYLSLQPCRPFTSIQKV